MGGTVSKMFTAMKKKNKSSTSSTSSRGGGGRGGGDVVEEGADDKQQLSATANVENDDLQRKMEKARLTQDLVFSNDLVSYIRSLRESTMN